MSQPRRRVQLPPGASRVALPESTDRGVAQQRGRCGERRSALRQRLRCSLPSGSRSVEGLEQALGFGLELSLRPEPSGRDRGVAITAPVQRGYLSK